MKIDDGTGTGTRAKVDSNHRLHVDALSKSAEHQANHEHGLSFTINFNTTPTGAGDCFFYCKNTDDRDMIIEGSCFRMVSDQYIEIKLGDSGTPAGGTAITPVNLNAGSGNTANGVFQYGSDITGLTGGKTAYRRYHASSQAGVYENFEQDIIIPKNSTISLYIETGGVDIHTCFEIFYDGVL